MNLTKITKTIYNLCEDLRETMMDLSIYYQHSFVQVPFHSFCWQPIQSAGKNVEALWAPKGSHRSVARHVCLHGLSCFFHGSRGSRGSHPVPAFL